MAQLLQVATQFSTGYGLYLPLYDLVVTSYRVVSNSSTVVISVDGEADQSGRVVYLDPVADLAFLEVRPPAGGEKMDLARFLERYGSGVDTDVTEVTALLGKFIAGNGAAVGCTDCRAVVFEDELAGGGGDCPQCGARLTLPSAVSDTPSIGINATIEEIIDGTGHNARLARRGPHLWRIQQGSASIEIAYHEDSGLVTGDAYLCHLPEESTAELYAYLLRENFDLSQLALSTRGRDIILSLLIYDRYLTVDTALRQFHHLFERADAYDNVLVERFGATWR